MRFTPLGKVCSFCGTAGRADTKFAGGYGALMCSECVARYHQIFTSRADLEGASRPPWADRSEDELLGNLELISATADQVDEFMQTWVDLLRSRRVPWSRIGEAMGISRQAAWQRFHHGDVSSG